MTNDEYRQLIEFLGQNFGEVERRFADMDGRFAGVDRQVADVKALIRASHGTLDRRVRRLEGGR